MKIEIKEKSKACKSDLSHTSCIHRSRNSIRKNGKTHAIYTGKNNDKTIDAVIQIGTWREIPVYYQKRMPVWEEYVGRDGNVHERIIEETIEPFKEKLPELPPEEPIKKKFDIDEWLKKHHER